ncbi:MAG: hypothetical protein ACYDGR_07235 [Candidatus Dormibacteria bacterium]
MFLSLFIVLGLALLIGSIGAVLVKAAKLAAVVMAAVFAWSLLNGSAGVIVATAVAAGAAHLGRRDLEAAARAVRSRPLLAISVPVGWMVTSGGLTLVALGAIGAARAGLGLPSTAAMCLAGLGLVGLGMWTMTFPLTADPLQHLAGRPLAVVQRGPGALGLNWGEAVAVARGASVGAAPLALGAGLVLERMRVAPGVWLLGAVLAAYCLRYALTALPGYRFERRCAFLRGVHRAEVLETMNRNALVAH